MQYARCTLLSSDVFTLFEYGIWNFLNRSSYCELHYSGFHFTYPNTVYGTLSFQFSPLLNELVCRENFGSIAYSMLQSPHKTDETERLQPNFMHWRSCQTHEYEMKRCSISIKIQMPNIFKSPLAT